MFSFHHAILLWCVWACSLVYDSFVLQKSGCFFIDKFQTIISSYGLNGDIELIFYQGCKSFYGLEGVIFATDELSSS